MNDNDLGAEADWIQRCKKGDKEAFSLLVKKYMKPAYYAALTFLGSHGDALDASQEAFVRAFRSMHSFDGGKRFYTWYYRILKNHCLNMLRRRRVPFVPMSMLEPDFDSMSPDPNPDAMMEQQERQRAVWDALWRLDVEDRELIVARDILDTPYATLAELLEVPIGTVMSRLYHARRRLREQLGEEWR